MSQYQIVRCVLTEEIHRYSFIKLMNAYMEDPMGKGESLTPQLADKIMTGLLNHPTYIGLLIIVNGDFVGLANCFLNFSTFKALPLLNIHDFIIHPGSRRLGAATQLLVGVEQMAKELGCCRINLEVRNDNGSALNLYEKFGFRECNPPMFFWEKTIS